MQLVTKPAAKTGTTRTDAEMYFANKFLVMPIIEDSSDERILDLVFRSNSSAESCEHLDSGFPAKYMCRSGSTRHEPKIAVRLLNECAPLSEIPVQNIDSPRVVPESRQTVLSGSFPGRLAVNIS